MAIMVSALQLEESWSFGSLVTVSVAASPEGPPPQLTKSSAPEGSPETLMVSASLTPSITLLTELPVMVSAPNPPVAPSMIGALPAFHGLR